MTIHDLLSKYWGHTLFRPLQEDIIQSVLDGRDTLALMPTGGGKSICFQIPALLKPGICIVVSPLIALMKDQVENLKSRGIPAIAITSGMGKREVDLLLDNCIYGPVKFLYLSPERLLSELVQERIRHMNVNLFAIDEAHCISQWGYDFRPPYLHLNELRGLHPQVPYLALTATATPRVATDIQQKLGFRAVHVLRKSFGRKNLSYVVFDLENKLGKLIAVAKKIKGSGIVYVRNRRQTQETARQLTMQGLTADFYHAGLDTALRTKKQTDWKEGRTRIIVATNAFGMGIDKADVRFVVHLDLPESLEAYYQEAGRAGRDEKKAYAVLLYTAADKLQLEKRLEQSFPAADEIRMVYQQLGNYLQVAYGAGEGIMYTFDVSDFCNRYKLDALKTVNALKILERDEYIATSDTVYLPGRAKIVIGQEDLYRFQVEQPAYDPFIKTLLRSYGGLFDHFVPVQEADLARRLGIAKEDVIAAFAWLQQAQLIEYYPQTDKPYLYFLKPRVDVQHLLIDQIYLRERYQLRKMQLNAVLDYAAKPICRSMQLLAYFDEQAEPCGVCDVCITEKRAKKQEFIKDEIAAELLQLLGEKRLGLDEAIISVKAGNEKEKLEVFRNLLDAGQIKTDGAGYYV